MPSVEIGTRGIRTVAEFGTLLLELMDHAEQVKKTASIEPVLTVSDFDNINRRIVDIFGFHPVERPENEKLRCYAAIETVSRETFNQLIAKYPIASPEFVKVWNLLDILTIISDAQLCDLALVFWLVEELLDSQTIPDCRKVFDYLEARRERLTAKPSKSKNLVILRMCNELLRRLSRANDTSFCGRVFIFLFQSFPLGDRSSVNLRGEYHVENITTYDTQSAEEPTESADKMDVDTEPTGSQDSQSKNVTGQATSQKPFDPDKLYPIFWSLQESFSQPKKLFDAAHLTKFKSAMETTLSALQAHASAKGSVQSNRIVDEAKRGQKRKADGEEELSSAFNPKYLTSRDLFELEISDMAFRRHVLVQALIIMDFLVSLSKQEKDKIPAEAIQNKAVVYLDQVLSEEDTEWAVSMKTKIKKFLFEEPDGPFFYRMVDSILSRDKNWVRWKVGNCTPFSLDPMPPEAFVKAKSNIEKMVETKIGKWDPNKKSDEWAFLEDDDEAAAWERMKDPKRWKLPDLQSFKKKIADAKFDVDMAMDSKSKAEAEEVLAAQTWRALRVARTTKLRHFDKIEDYRNIDLIFKTDAEIEEDMAPKSDSPEDTRPIVMSGPTGVGKSSVIDKLLKLYPGVFKKVTRHTTRPQADGEVQGQTYVFTTTAGFNMLRDGDKLIECEEAEGHQYGTSRTSIAEIQEMGKIPVMEMSPDCAQQVKDWDFSARFVFVALAGGAEELRQRLGKSDPSLGDEKIEALAKRGVEEQENVSREDQGLFDKIVFNEEGDMDKAAKALAAWVYGKETSPDGDGDEEMDGAGAEGGSSNGKDGDAEMVDAATEKSNGDGDTKNGDDSAKNGNIPE